MPTIPAGSKRSSQFPAPLPAPTYPVASMAELHRYNGNLVAGLSDRSQAETLSQFYPPRVVASFQAWAVEHPTVDPRTWVPLAQAQVPPTTPEAQQVSDADIIARINSNQYLHATGEPPNNVLPPGAKPTPTQVPAGPGQLLPPPDAYGVQQNTTGSPPITHNGLDGYEEYQAPARAEELHGYPITSIPTHADLVSQDLAQAAGTIGKIGSAPGGGASGIAKAQHEGWRGALNAGLGHAREAIGNVVAPVVGGAENLASEAAPDWVGSAVNYDYNAAKGIIRGGMTVFPAPWEAWNALLRTTAGDTHLQDQLQGKYFLSDEERATAFYGVGTNKPAGSMKIPFDPGLSLKPLSAYDSQAQRRIIAAQKEWNETGRHKHNQSIAGAVKDQTQAGQVLNDPSLLFKTTDADGKTIQERSLLPNKIGQQRSELKAIEAYDIRTIQEKARGVAPMGWTAGRALAHPFADPNTTAFNAIAGITDGVLITVGDPMNWVPMGAAGTLLRAPISMGSAALRRAGVAVPYTLREALSAKGPEVTVALAPQRFQAALKHPDGTFVLDEAGNKTYPRPSSELGGVPMGRRAPAQVAAAKALGAEHIISPSLKVSEAGQVIGPFGVAVLKKQAWEYMSRGRGARMVAQIARETNAYKVWQMTGGHLDMAIARQLADADTPEKIKAIIAARMGYEIRDPNQFGSLGKSGPVMFRNRFMMDSAGLLGTKGRAAYRTNYQQGLDMGGTKVGSVARSVSSTGVGQFRMAPSTIALDLDDPNVTVEQLDAFFRGARMSGDEIAGHMDSLIRANTGAERYALLYGQNGALETVVRKALREQGLSEDNSRMLTRAFQGGLGDFGYDWLNSDIANGIGTAPGNMGRAVFENEQLSRAAALPDYRRLRRATGGMGRIVQAFGDDPVKLENALAEWSNRLTSGWRYAVLVRPAYVLRELGELSFAMSLGGYKGMFTHPAAFIAAAHNVALAKHISDIDNTAARWITGAPARRKYIHTMEGVYRLAPSLRVTEARINGQHMWQEVNDVITGKSSERVSAMYDAISATHGNLQMDEAGSRAASRTARTLSRHDPHARDAYIAAFVLKLIKAHGDRDLRNIANPEMTRKDVLEAFMSGGTYEMKQQMRPDLLTGSKASIGRYLTGYEDLLNGITAGGEADLLEAVLTGQFRGRPLMLTGHDYGPVVSKELRQRINDLIEDPVKGQLMPDVLHDYDAANAGVRWSKRFVNDFFDSVGEWSDIFARGPLIRAAYTKRVIELAPHMSPAARADAIKRLRDAGDIKLARKIAATQRNPAGVLGIDEVDHIASGFARSEAKRVFYDAHRRQNYALGLRVIMPFAQATFNTFRRWGELSMRNPQLAYRATKPVEAMMDPGSAAMYQIASALIPGDDGLNYFYNPKHPELGADGFFATNQYGDRQLYYPGWGTLANALPGLRNKGFHPVGVGSVPGLNVAGTSAFPGVGPFITLPEALVVPSHVYEADKRGMFLRAINQFGVPQGSLLDKLVGSFGSTMMRKLQANSDPLNAGNKTVKTMPGTYASGDYDLSTDQGINRWVRESKTVGDRVGFMDILGSAVTPGSVATQLMVEANGDKTGHVRTFVLIGTLRHEYRKYIEPLPGQDPLEAKNEGELQFVIDFGDRALLSAIPMTDTTGAQATNDIWHWRADHPLAYKDNQQIIGMFFAGGDPTGEFAQNAYSLSKSTGERTNTEPHHWAEQVNNEMGYLLWNKAQKDIDKMPAKDQAMAKANVKAALMDKYPGFPIEIDQNAFTKKMNAVKSALDNPAVSSLASAYYIETYIKTRDDALADVKNRLNVTSLKTKDAQQSGATQQLVDLAKQLRIQDTSGGFMNFWSRLASKEFEKGAIDQ